MKQLKAIILLFAAIILAACTDEEKFTTDPGSLLLASKSEIVFDTVFSTIGSSTKQFTLYNNNSKSVRITSARLASGGASGFRMNIDGQYGNRIDNIEVLRHDSILGFVEVTVNPHDSDSPILVRDSILFTLESGVQQKLLLQAYGQDIIVLSNKTFTESTTLDSPRPYVVYGEMLIDTFANVIFSEGTQICFHDSASLRVRGNIQIAGTAEKPVVFRCYRTDRILPYLPYDRLDRKWKGILIDSISYGNTIDHADIHGSTYGIHCLAADTTRQKIKITNSTIHNVGGTGLQLENCYAEVTNTQISNCRTICLSITGGKTTLAFNTIAQFYPWSSERGYALYFSNINATGNYIPLTQLDAFGCFITGYGQDDICWEMKEKTDTITPVFNYLFDHCVLNTSYEETEKDHFLDCTLESTDSPSYKDVNNFKTLDTENFIYDFHLTPISSARGKASDKYQSLYPTDHDGELRTDTIDAGCYQYRTAKEG